MPVATEDALTGLGMAPQLADLLGAQPNTQAGTGTSQTGATILKNQSVEVTASGGNTNFILPSGSGFDYGPNIPYHLYNSSGTTAVINAPVGQTLNGTLNGTLSLTTSNRAAIIWQYKKGFWASILTA